MRSKPHCVLFHHLSACNYMGRYRISQLTTKCMLKLIWYYIHHYRPAWPYRLPIMFAVGVCPPTLVSWYLMNNGHGTQRAGEITFVLMIPVVIWLMDKINQRWLDDSDWDPDA